MSKSIELIRKSSWDKSELDEPSIIETCCPGRNLALVASSNQIAIFDYLQCKVAQSLRIPSGDTICSASFHPSGNHIIVAFKDKLQLANVLVDGIAPFWEAHVESCIDCKFNRRGTIFAAICGKSIIVYDFLNGREICKFDCNGTNFTKLKWGANCTAHVVCKEGLHICKWDALTGSKLADYSSVNGNILAYTVTTDSKTLIASSNNSITYLNRDLKHDSTVQVGEEYVLSGAICVSNEGLVFVGMYRRDDTQATLVRIYSAVGGDYFDQPIKEICLMEISTDGRYLITCGALFQVQDRRGYNQYITSCLDISSSEDYSATDNQTEVLVSKSHVESKDALLSDLQSKLTEVEIMNELKLRSVHQGHNHELRLLRESYDAKLSGLGEQRAQMLQEKRRIIQLNQLNIKDTVSAQLSEIHQLEEKYRSDILDQVNEYCRLEEGETKEALCSEEEREQLRQKHGKQLAEFRAQSDQKLSTQRETTSRLESQKADLECQIKETIVQLEDEIDDSISLLATKFEKEITDERETYERLALENGILRRRIASTRETIDGVNDRVASLLHKEEDYQRRLRKREDERERLDAIRNSKYAEQTSKDDAVSRLTSINHQLSKTRDIEKDRLQEVKNLTQRGPLMESMNKLNQELRSKTSDQEQQQQTHVSMKETIAKLKGSVSTEQKKAALLENKIRSYDSTINEYLVKLEGCNAAIQNPKKLSQMFFSMQESSTARQSPKDKQNNGAQTADEMNDNQVTFLFLEKMNELDELKVEDADLIAKFKEEKSKQITINVDLLNKVSSKTSGSRRRSSVFKRYWS